MRTDRQKEIINVALELIDKKGIQGLTIKNISQAIGVTEPAIYRHFENKNAILTEILDFFRHNSTVFFEKEITKENSASDKIRHLFENHFTSFSDTPALVSVIFAEGLFKNEKDLTIKIQQFMNHNNDIIVSIITKGQASGEFRNDIEATDMAIMVMGSLRLYVKRWHFSNYSFNLTVKGKTFIDSILTLIRN
jgi:AcrR family transcriptional regulator